jgi:hypothetical protein
MKKTMTDDEIINLAIKELEESEKVYKMFSEFSFMKGLETNDPRFIKIRYMLVRIGPFEKHTENAIKLSAIGLKVINEYKDWFHYKKSLRPKKDFVKIGSFVIALLSFVWIVFQEIRNDNLKNENADLRKSQDSLTNQTILQKDSITKLNFELDFRKKSTQNISVQNKK